MGRVMGTLAAIGSASVFAGLAGAALAQTSSYPVDVRIPVKLTSAVGSETSHTGDTFTFVSTKPVTLGTVSIPAGALGSGRVAVADPGTDKHSGVIEIQADSLAEPDGQLVSVNADPQKVYGHYVGKHRDIALDSGSSFEVITVEPRAGLAPLVTPSPSPVPTDSPAPAAPPAVPSAPPAGPAAPIATAPPTVEPMATGTTR